MPDDEELIAKMEEKFNLSSPSYGAFKHEAGAGITAFVGLGEVIVVNIA